MVLQPTDYLFVPKQCENPKARLVCFPHSGGGPSAFGAWPELLEAHQIELVAVCPPGRERRVGQPLVTDWRELVAAVCQALVSSGLVDDVPYALLGHSLGALLAYETARRLELELLPGRPRPLHLFASGHGGPAAKSQARDIPEWGRLHTLQDGALVRAVQAFGVLPPEVAADEGLMRAVVPALRADLQMYEDYAPDADRKPLQLGITALGGREDKVAPPDHLNTWAAETSKGLSGPELYPGGHFFLESCREEVLASIAAHMTTALDSLPRSVFTSQLALPEACNRLLLHEAVFEAGKKTPEAEALVGDSDSMSYGELLQRVQLLARKLQRDHLKGRAGQVVALLMVHDPTYVACMLGIWQAAAVLIVIEAHFPAALCKEICEESGTIAAISSPEHASKFDEVKGCQTLVLQGAWPEQLQRELDGMAAELPRPALEDLSILMMTSGTTGRPKTIAGTHHFMHSGARAKELVAPYGEEDCREGFNVMFVWEVVRPLVQGLTSIIIPDEAVLDPQLFVSTLQKHRCSRVLTTPSLLATVLQYCARGLGERLEAMRTWVLCGEVVPLQTVQSFSQMLPDCKLLNDYSSWESGDVAYAALAPRPAYEPSSIFAAAGALAPGCCAVVVEPERRTVQPLGVPGELYIGGAALSSGYYAQAELTAAKFVEGFTEEMREAWPGRWYKTGDAGRFVGSPPVLEIRGRIDTTVKIRGFKVGLPVVEAALQETPGVAACAVVPVYEGPAIVDSLLGFLQPEDGISFEEAVKRVKREASQRIPRWMVPSYFKPMPQAVSGGESRKLDRKRLAQLFDLQTLREEQVAEQTVPEAKPAREAGEEEDEAGVRAIVRSVWAKALNLNPQALDLEENFFDIGGHSTLAAKIAAELSGDYGLPVTVLDIYSHSSLGALLEFVDSKNGAAAGSAIIEARRMPRGGGGAQDEGIAIVGLAGRFPGADDADQFWQNLLRSTVSATFLSKEFLRSKDVPEATINHKDFVPCAYKINDADMFDHGFFGIGRHEASLMDPQHRVFVETSWAALENAAIVPRGGLSDSVVGVFAAAGIDGYLVHHLDGMPLKDSTDPQDIFLAEIGNEKDYIATRVSYLLDFTGPSMNVNSACSSALVACVQSAAAITGGQCDAAVAGASSITFPNLGFLYQDGLVNSVDGYVRPFDEKADGTVFGDSVASMVLRRQGAAGSLVWAGLRGFAVTNDGGQKAGYAAPSPLGQSMAVMGAQQMLGEDPWSVSYVECHCTGTRVGDGIEVRGLMDAFAQLGGKRSAGEASVALGSVKGNIAHANCAAGATGLIKTMLMLRSRSIVPTANFSKLNPKISLERSPFFVNPELCSWEVDGRPLRAGVSSFGIGGTNAHVILEEAPPEAAREEAATPGRPRWGFHVLPLSGRSPAALHAASGRLAAAMRDAGAERSDLDRVAFTLQTGRSGLPLRKAIVLPTAKSEGQKEDLAAAAEALEAQMPELEELEDLEDAAKRPQVAFAFPGQGSQYFGMGRGLYSSVPLFREAADRCCDLLAEPERLGRDLRPLLFPAAVGGAEEEREREVAFALPSVLQPALFIVEYGLAEVFQAIGIVPVAAAGHSLGEYAAAVVGGLLSLESALGIVAARAKATETLAEDGAMLSVAGWSEQELAEVGKGKRPGLWLAAVNSPAHAVISGEEEAVAALETELKEQGRKCTKLHVRKAFHSGLIAKAADTLKGLGLPQEAQAGVPAVPVASNFTGGWLNALQLKDGTYWTSHMRGTVRWRDNAERLLAQWKPAAVLEVGPGSALSTLTAKCVGKEQTAPAFVQATRHPKAVGVHDVEALLAAVGKLWELGCGVDWQALHTKVLGVAQPPQLLRLPAYAFDRTSLWANPERSVYVDNVEDPAPVAYSKLGQAGALAPATAAAPAPWLLRFGERLPQEPSIRAYCLPFASGSATLFAPWAEQADAALEVVALELPGRGARADEPMPGEEAGDEAMLEAVCDAILADLRGAKYVLVGFSMGGGLCADLALRLAARGAPAPLAVYVAGRRPPAMNPDSVGPITMSNEDLAEYAFAPPEVAQSQEFAEHVVPLLRGDLEADARCERRLAGKGAEGARLPAGVGLELFCGTEDGVAPWREAPGWQRFVQEPVGLHYFPGGHEFMQECRPLLHAAIRRDAIARLVRQRSAELALLAAQGLAPPGAPALVPAPAPAAAAAEGAKAERRELPLYAVRWAPATAGDAQWELPAPFFVNLAEELSDATLAAAAAAMRASTPLLAACGRGSGVLKAGSLEVEVAQAWHFVQLVQRLLDEGCAGRLLLLCPVAASGAMVAGASKAVALEASELQIQRIFLPSAALEDSEARAGELLKLAQRHSQEVDIWVQDGALQGPVFAPRLEPMPEPSVRLPCFPKRSPDGSLPTFVLTGATGGLGKAVVEWMLREQGLLPEQLVLLRRSGSAPLAGALAACRAVEVGRPDSEEALLASSLAELRSVAGVLHLAGALDDGVVQGMTAERMRKVAVPKCDLLVALLRAAKALSWPLAWAVGFSSTSSLLGYPGQVNYCAANALLDQLASFGATGGLPEGDQAPCRVMAINWGPWAEAGMAKVGTKAYEQALQDGDTPLPTATALACLAAALRVAAQAQPAATQLCACDVDWPRSQWRQLPILELLGDDLGPAAAAPATAPPTASAAGGGARKAVEDFLLQHTKSGSSWKRVQGKSLHQLGLDSLEVVGVRNQFNKRFGVSVPLGVVADSSRRLGALSEELLKHVQQ